MEERRTKGETKEKVNKDSGPSHSTEDVDADQSMRSTMPLEPRLRAVNNRKLQIPLSIALTGEETEYHVLITREWTGFLTRPSDITASGGGWRSERAARSWSPSSFRFKRFRSARALSAARPAASQSDPIDALRPEDGLSSIRPSRFSKITYC